MSNISSDKTECVLLVVSEEQAVSDQHEREIGPNVRLGESLERVAELHIAVDEHIKQADYELAVAELAYIIGIDEEADAELYAALLGWLSSTPNASATMGAGEREVSQRLANAIILYGALDDLPVGPVSTQRLRELTGLYRDSRSGASRIIPPRDALARRIWSLHNNEHGLHTIKADALAGQTYAAIHEFSALMTESSLGNELNAAAQEVVKEKDAEIIQEVEVVEVPVHVRRAIGRRASTRRVVPQSKDYVDDDASSGMQHETVKSGGVRGDTRLTADGVKDYLTNIAKVPLLNAEQVVELSKAIEVGLFAQQILDNRSVYELDVDDGDLHRLIAQGDVAKDELLTANLRLVVSIAKRYQGMGLPFLDLMQEGNIGLVRAVEKFDYKKGYMFSTYATWWIKQRIRRAMADTIDTIRVPVRVYDTNISIAKIKTMLESRFGRTPTDEEVIAEHGKIIPQDMELFNMVNRQKSISLETPIGDDATLGDIIGDDGAKVSVQEQVMTNEAARALRDVLATFTEREARVISMRFGLDDGRPKGLDEIGRVFGVTRERIRQIEAKTLAKLRHPSRAHMLRDFLDS